MKKLRSFLILAFLLCLVTPSFFIFPIQSSNTVPSEVNQQFSSGFKEVYGAGGSKTLGVTTIAHDYDPYTPVDPKKIVLGDGTVVYQTTYGNYTMDKSTPYKFSYIGRNGVKYVDKSVFWVSLPTVTNTTYLDHRGKMRWYWFYNYSNPAAVLDIAKVGANVWYPSLSANNYWQIKYGIVYKGGSLSKETNIANLTVTWVFYREKLPKITILFEKNDNLWKQAGLKTYSIVWTVLPLDTTYMKVSDSSAVQVTAGTDFTKIGDFNYAELGSSSNAKTWASQHIFVDWRDAKSSCIVYKGTEKVFGGKGFSTFFPANSSFVDPTFGLTSTGSTTYPTAKVVTANDQVQIDTAQSKFGGASGLFDGTGTGPEADYLSLLDSDDWYFGTGDFTIDFQVRFNALPVDECYFYLQYVNNNNNFGFECWLDTGAKYYFGARFRVGGINYDVDSSASATLATNTWYHLALVRSGDSWYFFINGVQLGTTRTQTAAVPDLAGTVSIGGYSWWDAYYLNGWLDELRVSKGIARWTADFSGSLPSARYDRDSYTVLLLHNDLATGEVDGSPVFLDDVTTGTARATKVSVTETAYPTTISFYSHAAGNFRASIFSDLTGPNTKQWESGDTVAAASTWNNATITGVSLTTGTYHLIWQWNPGTGYVAGPSYTAGVAGDGNYVWQAYGSFPTTWTGGTSSSEKWSIFVTYSTTPPNSAPTNDALSLDLTGASYKGSKTLLCGKQDYKFVYLCGDAEGVVDISYAQIQLDPTGKNVILRATRGTGDAWTFAEQSDPTNYITLNVAGSSHSTSGTQKTFNFLVTINWVWGDSGETVAIRAYVIDSASASDQDDYANIFGVEAHLTFSSLAINTYSCIPSQSLTFSGSYLYDGTSLAPPDGDFNVQVKLNATVKATDASLVSGAFSVSFNAENVLGAYFYTVTGTYQSGAGSFNCLSVTSMSLTLTVSAIHGTYESKMNVTATFSNGTAVSGATFNAYSSILLGSAVSSGSGLAQFTFTGKSLQGSGTLVFNGTKNGVTGSCSVSYSISIGTTSISGPASWNMGTPETVSVTFTNNALINVTSVKLENVRVCFRVLSGSTVLFQANSSTFDVDASTVKSLSQTATLTGVQTTGDYTLRALIIQLGSEATLGTLDRTVRVQALGSESGHFTQSPRLVIPLIQPIMLKQGGSTSFKFKVELSQVSVAEFLAGSCSGVPSGWVTIKAPSRISLSSPAEIELLINVPSDAVPQSYELIIPFTASASSGSSRQSASLSLTVEAKPVSAPSFSILSAILEPSSIMIVVFVVIGFMLLTAVVLVLTGDKKPKYYHH
jgi:hypothetical protein